MEDQELSKLIEQLHDEIQKAQSLDKKDQELLAHLESDIRELLDRDGGEEVTVQPSTIRRVETGIDQFAITHPNLTTLLTKFLESLSNVGI